ncbi:MAG: hypothetical protein IH586_15560, partial [Anaerolineaceae bacterium]|nr:hypothetical protein [Anaerolineaceae bacterium]
VNLSVLVLEERDLENQVDWIRLAPQAVIYSPAKGEFPPEETTWLITRPQGWVHITTDGKKMWVERE